MTNGVPISSTSNSTLALLGPLPDRIIVVRAPHTIGSIVVEEPDDIPFTKLVESDHIPIHCVDTDTYFEMPTENSYLFSTSPLGAIQGLSNKFREPLTIRVVLHDMSPIILGYFGNELSASPASEANEPPQGRIETFTISRYLLNRETILNTPLDNFLLSRSLLPLWDVFDLAEEIMKCNLSWPRV